MPLCQFDPFARRIGAMTSLCWFAIVSVAAAQTPALKEINVRMQRYVDQQEAAGIVTLVSSHGKIVHLGAVGHPAPDAEAALSD
ncbi:MAG: hypothetical protein KDA61_06930, partial [Planctomycetales bacterium]|nr:hypothetical protein [Planctomycetales bacterium]